MQQKGWCSQSLTRLPSGGHQKNACTMSLHTFFYRWKRLSGIKETLLLPQKYNF